MYKKNLNFMIIIIFIPLSNNSQIRAFIFQSYSVPTNRLVITYLFTIITQNQSCENSTSKLRDSLIENSFVINIPFNQPWC